MTIAYWCVLVAAFLPLLWTFTAKFSGKDFRPENNHNPREYLDQLSGYRKRAHWAQLNAFEAFPPFAAGVIIAHLTHAPQDRLDLLALCFIGLRIAHGVLYIADQATLRSLVWMAGAGVVVAIFCSGTI
ncbi:MAG TPA: MAPEG family protein [Pseudomonadales bacterium]|nr:MAPEG family protein [Pseudomonadales bacterium]